MKRVLSVLLTGLFLTSFSAAFAQVSLDNPSATGDSIFDGLPKISVPQPGTPAVTPGPKAADVKPAPERKWTIMVFMNGKNNLEVAGLYNVNQMENIGSTKDMNIVVELGRMKGQEGDVDMDGDWTGARRILVKKDKDSDKITSPTVATTETVDMGDYKRVVDFVTWSKKAYPAKKYMLILWDHGTGWLDPQQKKKEMPSKGISFDDETGNYIRTQQIGQILKESGKVDILAYDACLMQMGEVAFEVKDYTEVIVGSEETVPGYGFPYGIFLGVLAKNPGMSAEELGSITVDAFKLFYDKVKKSAQLSAIRSSKLDTLGAKLAEFGKLAKDVNDAEALKAARTGVMRYDILGKDSDPNMTISFFGDLAQYAQLLAANAKGTDAKTASLKEKSAALQDFIKKELVIANKASGKNNAGRELSESTGISVYLPPAEVRVPQEKLEGIFEGKYTEFAFDKATGWHDFVTYLYGVK